MSEQNETKKGFNFINLIKGMSANALIHLKRMIERELQNRTSTVITFNIDITNKELVKDWNDFCDRNNIANQIILNKDVKEKS